MRIEPSPFLGNHGNTVFVSRTDSAADAAGTVSVVHVWFRTNDWEPIRLLLQSGMSQIKCVKRAAAQYSCC